ncbi:hypothetical protein [Helicobacter pylori]|uniref:Poly E-rich protein n=1 Tax=Helicobacter pylori (strain SouthAfrica7) TaxID=907239 RepID=E8QV62_HELPW|nr:hypothetical protein [Helicobacter pylori]ADU84349.1 hypothetical protein HPSA_01635 [Helicobacter pylori SouthAfrica7]
MTMIVFNQNPMIAKLLESVSKKLELPMENFNHYEELSARLKKDPEWLLIADDESLEKLDQVDWLELKEIISQNHLNLCMYKKGNEVQPFLEGFEVKMKKPFLPTEVLKILQKKLGFNASEPESSQNLEPVKETLEANWDALEDLGDLESLAKEEPNAEEQLLPTLDAQKENEEIKEEEKQEVAETPQEKEVSQELENPQVQEAETQEVAEQTETQELETPKDETQENAETPQEKEVSKELETLQTQEAETQEIQEEKQEQEQVKEKTQDSPSAQELEAMQELVKEIQENSNEDKKETQEIAEIPQTQEEEIIETPQEIQTQEITETPQTQETETETQEVTEQKETQEITETPQEAETKTQDQETPPKTQETQENYETIEDIPEPVMAKAMGEALPLVNEALIETSNNENAAQTPKESVTQTPQENAKIPQKSDATSSPLELRLNLQDLLKSLNQESLKSLLENKTLSIKITLEDKNPHA